ncbi:phosphoserine transaminase [Schaalia sp. 19OD2882]|uniref:phosphoserine transaminase n=1 Tax=Schaalia sp. 19OD2882 TaxID=2794089 RepID=UPI001C1EB52B|nr:phosphoserine transaminase [Schaalia sp. 19OD2882]QWW19932.1 phosphoserine transaminase [Schaalia sp. 19OD2882]
MAPTIPPSLLPADGRFGSGPSRVRPEQLQAIVDCGLMGTSHRQTPVKNLVASLREGVAELFALPQGWQVVLGNGGATTFWAVAATSLVRRRAAHAVFGEFGAKFAAETARAPHLAPSILVEAPVGGLALLTGEEGADDEHGPVDVFAHPHHETSTGVLSPIRQLGTAETLTLVDATSVAGGVQVDVGLCDVYYFSPQKCFASDGGLWIALVSPAAQERARELHAATDRWMPQILDLSIALDNSVKDQTLNTPALATLVMMDNQVRWMLDRGGLAGMEARSRAASGVLYDWAEASPVARPFVEEAAHRSPVVVTIDFDEQVDAAELARNLRANGIVDVEPYRGLGRNQLRVATFPVTDEADTRALVACLDWALEHSL